MIVLPKQSHDSYMHWGLVHKYRMILLWKRICDSCMQRDCFGCNIRIVICTEAWCVHISWVCVNSKILIYIYICICTEAWCIHISWVCAISKILLHLSTEAWCFNRSWFGLQAKILINLCTEDSRTNLSWIGVHIQIMINKICITMLCINMSCQSQIMIVLCVEALLVAKLATQSVSA